MDAKALIALVLDHARGMWRFRWPALGIAWLISLIGFVLVLSLPNTYQASARVFVDTDNLLRPLLKGLYVETNLMSDVTVMTRALVSRPSLEKVVRDTDFDIGAVNQAQTDALLRSLEQRVRINAERRANIYTISFTDSDRNRAVQVVQSLLNSFVESTLGSNLQSSEAAEATLKAQIAEYEQRLLAAEDRLTRFKQENVGLMPGQAGGYYQRLQTALDALEDTQRRREIAQEQRVSLQRQISGLEPVAGGSMAGAVSAYDQQIAALEQRRIELLMEYTENHPEVVRLAGFLEELYEKRTQEQASGSRFIDAANDANRATNPLFQNLQIQLSQVNVELASLNAELRDRQADLDELRELVDVIPEVEAELTRLDRDYNVIRERHQEMLSRWEVLQTGKLVSSGRDQVTFNVIDPPFAASAPSGPNRTLFLLLAICIAAGSGIALAWLLNMMKPSFTSIDALQAHGLQVLGSIGHNRSAAMARAQNFNTISLLALAGMLIIAFVVGTYFSQQLSATLHSLF